MREKKPIITGDLELASKYYNLGVSDFFVLMHVENADGTLYTYSKITKVVLNKSIFNLKKSTRGVDNVFWISNLNALLRFNITELKDQESLQELTLLCQVLYEELSTIDKNVDQNIDKLHLKLYICAYFFSISGYFLLL